ncbi:unnamed protein product [Polarella glacialis]|uniref:Uncharacterized protein n=1 Tax=Polarella glacialis TaxID=89957 RepID=A0A813LHM4_POLGL|nr:unnamed protein product [Polarella glacialis]
MYSSLTCVISPSAPLERTVANTAPLCPCRAVEIMLLPLLLDVLPFSQLLAVCTSSFCLQSLFASSTTLFSSFLCLFPSSQMKPSQSFIRQLNNLVLVLLVLGSVTAVETKQLNKPLFSILRRL